MMIIALRHDAARQEIARPRLFYSQQMRPTLPARRATRDA